MPFDGMSFKQYDYKAALTTTANAANRPELVDIYDSAIQTTLNEMSTFYRLTRKIQNRGDFANWTVRSGRNPSIGSNAEIPIVTSGFAQRLKLQQHLAIEEGFPEVSDFEIAAQAVAGVSPIDIYTQEVQNATIDLLSTPYTTGTNTGVNAQMFRNGAGNSGLDMMGLAGWIDTSGASISGVTTLGGLPRATNSFLNGTGINTTTEPISTSRMRSTLAQLSDAGSHLNQMLIVTTATLRNRILDLMMPAQRYTTEAKFGFGVMELPTFDDIPVYADKDCEANKIYFLDMSTVEARVLRDFHYEDMAKTTTSRKGKVAMYGQLIVKAPVFNSVLTNKS